MNAKQANRAARRQQKHDMKRQNQLDSMTIDGLRRDIQRNGITKDHLAYEYRHGCKDGAEYATKGIYASVAIALHDLYGFGRKRLFRAIKAIDEQFVLCIDADELVEEAEKRTGYRINFKEPTDRVEELR